jgi:hypothetical protein
MRDRAAHSGEKRGLPPITLSELAARFISRGETSEGPLWWVEQEILR